jgi:hypothetical protein
MGKRHPSDIVLRLVRLSGELFEVMTELEQADADKYVDQCMCLYAAQTVIEKVQSELYEMDGKRKGKAA